MRGVTKGGRGVKKDPSRLRGGNHNNGSRVELLIMLVKRKRGNGTAERKALKGKLTGKASLGGRVRR